MARVYMDYNATAPMAEAVEVRIREVMGITFGNPSSVHAEGRQARQVVEQARAEVASLIGAEPAEVLFTGSATEANNFVIRGCAEASRAGVITSAVEHPSVLGAVSSLGEAGVQTSVVSVDSRGALDMASLESALVEGAGLVSIMHGNNETGVVFDLQSIRELTRRHDVLLHVDAVQTAGRLPLDVRSLDLDFLTLSGHKMGGLKGAAALFMKRGLRLSPLHAGGHQERGLRGGTEVTWAIAGLGAAADVARNRLEKESSRIARLRDQLWEGISLAITGAQRNGLGAGCLPNTLNVGFSGCPGDQLLIQLDMEGVSASSGSACTSGTVEPSHVLMAMGRSPDEAREAVRFSLGEKTTEDDIVRVLEVLPVLVERTRGLVVEGEWENWEASL